MYEKIKTKDDYDLLLKSGMFFEFHPELSGNWEQDKNTIADNFSKISYGTPKELTWIKKRIAYYSTTAFGTYCIDDNYFRYAPFDGKSPLIIENELKVDQLQEFAQNHFNELVLSLFQH